MSNHTPGPWEFRKDGFIYSLSTGERVCSPHSTLCNSHSVSEHTQDLKRNARLIAAAPELLDALQIARNYVEAVYLNTPNPKKARNYSQCLDIIDAAITKAKGEQTK